MTIANVAARNAIMRAIRENLAASAPHDAASAAVAASVRAGLPQLSAAPLRMPSSSEEAPLERFKQRLAAVGGRWLWAHDVREASTQLAGIVRESNARRVVCSDAPVLQRLLSTVQEVRVETVGAMSRDDLFECDVGITMAQLGIAETGTLILESESEANRLASLLPQVHLAVLSANNICDTIGEALARVTPTAEKGSRAITFITGPSRTSDIELTLTIGVHGPKALHVILVENIT